MAYFCIQVLQQEWLDPETRAPGGFYEDCLPGLDSPVLNTAVTISILTFQHINKWGRC